MSKPNRPHPHLRVAREGAVQTITLSNVARLNAQTPSMWAALAELAARLDPPVRVVVLNGDGPSFSSGLDRAMLTREGVDGLGAGTCDRRGLPAGAGGRPANRCRRRPVRPCARHPSVAVPNEALAATTSDLVATLVAAPEAAARELKPLLRRALTGDREEQLRRERDAQGRLLRAMVDEIGAASRNA